MENSNIHFLNFSKNLKFQGPIILGKLYFEVESRDYSNLRIASKIENST